MRTLEQRIKECLPKALKIICQEKDLDSAFLFTNYKHRWQYLDACKDELVSAIRQVAATKVPVNRRKIVEHLQAAEQELARTDAILTGELRELKAKVEATVPPRQKRTTGAAQQKMAAVTLSDRFDFVIPTMTGATVQSQHARLAQMIYTAATGDASSVRHQVEEYYEKMIAPVLDKETDKAGRTRARRRDKQKVKPDVAPSAELWERMEEDVEAWRKVWEQPRPK